jgi:hypothetical protein
LTFSQLSTFIAVDKWKGEAIKLNQTKKSNDSSTDESILEENKFDGLILATIFIIKL